MKEYKVSVLEVDATDPIPDEHFYCSVDHKDVESQPFTWGYKKYMSEFGLFAREDGSIVIECFNVYEDEDGEVESLGGEMVLQKNDVKQLLLFLNRYYVDSGLLDD